MPDRYFFFATVAAGARSGVTVDVEGLLTTMLACLGCLGFFASRLLRNWPLAMVFLLQ